MMFTSKRRFSLGDLISSGAGAAAAGAGGGVRPATATATAVSTAAASSLVAVRQASAATAQRNAAASTSIAGAITGALSALAGAAGGPAGQWISFLLGGTTAPPSTTIAPNDLKTMRDVFGVASPLAVSTLTVAKVAVPTDTTALAVLDYFIGYIPRVKAAVDAACAAGGADCGVGAPVPAVPAVPAPATDPYLPRDWGDGYVGDRTPLTTDSSSALLLPIGALVVAAAAYFYMKK